MKRTPMSRGTGFKPKSRPARAPVEIESACGLPGEVAEIARRPAPAVRRGTYAAPAPVAAVPKTPRREIPHLLDMACGKPCLFRVRGICNHDPATTVAAHSNWAEHGGKGGARKADDCYSAWACHACHTWLDSGPADGELKKVTFMFAHLSQVRHWRAIAADPASKPRDRAAVLLALDHLNATPVGQGEMP
ncbi:MULTISPECIES: nuclease domain-containing protein [unclassified Variovorax]|uniref:nuclease domain-containing protein n=1 Tax=unclassified Variovorax TaxID=663243 RepID=UPI0034E87CDA